MKRFSDIITKHRHERFSIFLIFSKKSASATTGLVAGDSPDEKFFTNRSRQINNSDSGSTETHILIAIVCNIRISLQLLAYESL